jgi:hypothetical protein
MSATVEIREELAELPEESGRASHTEDKDEARQPWKHANVSLAKVARTVKEVSERSTTREMHGGIEIPWMAQKTCGHRVHNNHEKWRPCRLAKESGTAIE